MIKKYKQFINEAKKSDNIFDAVRNGDMVFIKAYKGDLNVQDKDGYTPLMWASYYYKKNIIKYLIENGADINIKDDDGDTVYCFRNEYYDSYGFQKWYMETIGNYEKLNIFVQGNIHYKIKKEYPMDIFKSELGL